MNKKYYVLLLLLYIIYLYNFTYKNENIYMKKVYITSNNVVINSINNKLLIKKKYGKNEYNLKNGIYKLYFNQGQLTSYKESYFNNIRFFIDNRIKKVFFGYDLYSYSKALLLYDKSYFDILDKKIIKDIAISHIFSLSGFHLMLIYTTILYILKNLSIKLKEIIVFILISIYVFTIGFIPSITRAYIIIMILSLSKILNENVDNKKSFFIAFILTFLINPYQILNISYVLSYLVYYILIIFEKKSIILKSLLVEIITMPLILYYFKSFNLLMFLINVILMPIFTILIYLIIIALILNFNFFTIFVEEYLQLIRILMYLISKIKFFTLIYNEYLYIILLTIYFIVFIYYIKKYKLYTNKGLNML